MNGQETITLDDYYEYVMEKGLLLTKDHAKRWSNGVLKTLGTALDRRTKKALAKALPEELGESLTSVFWLAHFRDPNQSTVEFCSRVARRSGNSNGEFALHPTIAVFSGVRSLIDNDLDERVSKSLSPQLSELWGQANYELLTVQ